MTILLSPILSLLLPLCALTLLFPPMAPLSRILSSLVLFVVDRGAEMRGVLLPVNQIPTLSFLGLMTLGLILLAVTGIKARYAVPVVSLFLVLGIGSACLAPI